ncbi:two-component system, CitB family, sensor histidine kinase MalK/two-component system, CitB family, sensor histidine kinase DctS [Alteribacillus persepolensis]|uniref:histidine kinase n=1 Tax=Alteribacillus persepolensis TaxID=568899 RepID=A0A1G8EFR6_9BACI|nr:sensor histidine kinase [Alteribacillus persepolensis]SDH68724.1 two-component system, CitB family, sensor histidine kinase MalK/two-component system, CitB family, sensor histidine kinase DctS [Alteribacillus persepolensis]
MLLRNVSKNLSLQTKMMIYITSIIVISVLIMGVFSYRTLHQAAEESTYYYLVKAADILSKLDIVEDTLQNQVPANNLQASYEEFLKEEGNEDSIFIVLIDQEGTRYTHPNSALIGEKITGNDVKQAFNGQTYISSADGISGPTIRAFVPVNDSETGEQIGVFSVGVLQQSISDMLLKYLQSLNAWLIFTIIFGAVVAVWMARRIKKILHGFEPREIAALFREKEAMLESMSEGILAIDNQNRVTLLNRAAKTILNIDDQLIGQKLERFPQLQPFAHSINDRTVCNKDIEIRVNNVIIMARYQSIVLEHQVVHGTIISFRDITAVEEMAEELTGVQQYVDALRAKTHEFMNKLQTLSGLVELKRYQEVKDYIIQTTHQQQKKIHFFKKHIQEPKLTGLLLGKCQQAEETNTLIHFTPGSSIGKLPASYPVNSLVLIIGNLVQNAIEILRENDKGEIIITLLDETENIHVIIEDNGPGIEEENLENVFKRGFTSNGQGRGIGLSLVKYHVDQLLKGSIMVDSSVGEGTAFYLTLPKRNYLPVKEEA